MTRLLKKRPEGIKIFEGCCNTAVFFENYDEAGPYAYVGFEIYANKANLHIQILRWSHNIAKMLKGDWDIHALVLLELGVNLVVAIGQDAEDKRWSKFVRLFGFPKPQMVQEAWLKLIKEKS